MENGLYFIYSKSFFLLDYFLVTLRRGGGAQFPPPLEMVKKKYFLLSIRTHQTHYLRYKGNFSLRLNFFKHMLTSL